MMGMAQLLIDGEFLDAESGKIFGTEDPRTGKKLIDVAEAQKEDVDKAVNAARKVELFGSHCRRRAVGP